MSLNLSANICTGITKRAPKTILTPITASQLKSVKVELNQKGNPETKKATDGVGIPLKDVVCRESILNLANRSAENAAIVKGT